MLRSIVKVDDKNQFYFFKKIDKTTSSRDHKERNLLVEIWCPLINAAFEVEKILTILIQ